MRLSILIMTFRMFLYDNAALNQPKKQKTTQTLHASCHMYFACAGTDVFTSCRADCWAVLVTTPIMRRAQLLNSARDTIFVDSTSSCDATKSTVTVLLTATKAGAVPIAVVVHNSQSKEGYALAFELLRNNYPLCFGNSQVGEHKQLNRLFLLLE